MDLLARSRAVLHASAPGALVHPWLNAFIVGAFGHVVRILGLATAHPIARHPPQDTPQSASFIHFIKSCDVENFKNINSDATCIHLKGAAQVMLHDTH